MKEQNKKSFRLRVGFFVYLLVVVFAVFFTQMLRSHISSVFMWFTVLLPILSLAYTLLGKSAIQVFVSCSTERTEKNAPVDYEIRIINSSFLPYPFIEAELCEPADNAARCEGKRLALSLVSFGGYIVNKTVNFKYRGYYEIGVDSVYIRDMFGLFEARAAVTNLVGVSVAPRVLSTVGMTRSSVSDVPSPSERNFEVSERIEVSDIRDYRPGDPVKDIHWKLSSKTEEIKIRQFSTNEKKHIYILCDMARASEIPEENFDETYSILKKAVAEEKKGRREKVRIKRAEITEYDALQTAEKRSIFKDLISSVGEKRKAAKYKKNIKNGMSTENAEMASLIDDLIKEGDRVKLRRSQKKAEKKQKKLTEKYEGTNGVEDEAGLVRRDIEKILSAIGDETPEIDDTAGKYGGRVCEGAADDYDEFCADAVCEIALSQALHELKRGNRCTLLWFDRREENGVCSVDVSCSADFERAKSRLAGAATVPSDCHVSKLISSIPETGDVTVKTVTSNIDPVSLGELWQIPSRFGGAGTGCVAEVLLFSPDVKFENPSLRSVYIDDAVAQTLRRGIAMTQLTEQTDRCGISCFEPVAR